MASERWLEHDKRQMNGQTDATISTFGFPTLLSFASLGAPTVASCATEGSNRELGGHSRGSTYLDGAVWNEMEDASCALGFFVQGPRRGLCGALRLARTSGLQPESTVSHQRKHERRFLQFKAGKYTRSRPFVALVSLTERRLRVTDRLQVRETYSSARKC